MNLSLRSQKEFRSNITSIIDTGLGTITNMKSKGYTTFARKEREQYALSVFSLSVLRMSSVDVPRGTTNPRSRPYFIVRYELIKDTS